MLVGTSCFATRNQFKLQPFGSHGLDAPFPIIVGFLQKFDLSTLLIDLTL